MLSVELSTPPLLKRPGLPEWPSTTNLHSHGGTGGVGEGEDIEGLWMG